MKGRTTAFLATVAEREAVAMGGMIQIESPQGRYARREARHASVRAAWSEDIARSTPLPATWEAGVQMTDELQETIVAYGAACALRAMNEYRGKE